MPGWAAHGAVLCGREGDGAVGVDVVIGPDIGLAFGRSGARGAGLGGFGAFDGRGVAQAEHGVERAEDAAEAGVGGEQGLEGGVFHEVLEFEAGVGAGDDGAGRAAGEQADEPGEAAREGEGWFGFGGGFARGGFARARGLWRAGGDFREAGDQGAEVIPDQDEEGAVDFQPVAVIGHGSLQGADDDREALGRASGYEGRARDHGCL